MKMGAGSVSELDFIKEGRIDSFGYTVYLQWWAKKRGVIKPKKGKFFGTKLGKFSYQQLLVMFPSPGPEV